MLSYPILLRGHTATLNLYVPNPQDRDIEKEGILQRKNELDEGSRKAVMRSWRSYYTVLIGPLLNFYRDRKDFKQYVSACPPINVTQGECEAARDYQKKKYALRLR